VSVVVVVVAAWQWDPSYGRRTCRLCDVTPTPGTMTSLVNGSLSNDDGDVPVLTNRRQLSKQQVEGQRQRLDTVMMLTLLSSAGTVRHCNNDTSLITLFKTRHLKQCLSFFVTLQQCDHRNNQHLFLA